MHLFLSCAQIDRWLAEDWEALRGPAAWTGTQRVNGGDVPAPGMAVAAEVSLAVAAKASAENFPVALRVLPGALARAPDRAVRLRAADRRHRRRAAARPAVRREPGDGHRHQAQGCSTSCSRTSRGSTTRRPSRSSQRSGRCKRPSASAACPASRSTTSSRPTGRTSSSPGTPPTRTWTNYCELSANPVGQVVLYIMGAATPERIAASDSICTALQVIEHCQDVAEDLANGRIYLPQRGHDAPASPRRTWRSRPRARMSGADPFRGGPRATAARRGSAARRHPQGRRQAGHRRLRGRRPRGAQGDQGGATMSCAPRRGRARRTRAMMARCYVKGR